MKSFLLSLAFILVPFFQTDSFAKVTISKLFSSDMVLQRDQKILVWGWADLNEKIVLTFNEKTYRANPDENGKWSVKLFEMPAGGPFEMVVAGMENKIIISNILIGDVWLCSGQSNMEWLVSQSKNPQKEIKNATDTKIRHFKFQHAYSEFPIDTIGDGIWKACTPQSVGDFTAVGYFFARELRKYQDIPIGILNVSWGASKIQAWMDTKSLNLKSSPFGDSPIGEYLEKEKAETRKLLLSQLDTLPLEDMGKIRNVPVWAQYAYPDNDWQTMELPTLWEASGLTELDGVVWFRKEVFLSKEEAQNGITLHLGKIDDTDSTYVNGKFVGSMVMAYDQKRVYEIPAIFLKDGRNIITVWVEDPHGGGGIYGEKTDLYYQYLSEKVSLSGPWKYKVGKVLLNSVKEPNKVPTLLYNAMINPLKDFPIKGVLWYQGEENANRKEAYEYRNFIKKMIPLWRETWNIDYPFFWVQLANYQSKTDDPNQPSNWAMLRESQAEALDLQNTGQAIAIDIGETWDIHPKNKQAVGFRLSLIARSLVYGEEAIVYSGPVYKSMEIEGNKIRLKFEHKGSGLFANDGSENLASFKIAGKDRKFVWANAIIEGDEIVVWNDKIKKPQAVRYAWSNNPNKINFYNKEKLPAAPFRTDNW